MSSLSGGKQNPIQATSAGLCNRMWNLVTYLYNPWETHTVFSFL